MSCRVLAFQDNFKKDIVTLNRDLLKSGLTSHEIGQSPRRLAPFGIKTVDMIDKSVPQSTTAGLK